MRASRIFSGILSVAASIGLAVACGGSGGGGSGIFGSGGGGGSANGGNTGGYGAFGTGGVGIGGFGAGGGSGGGLNPDAACANLNVGANRIPVAMYIMLDKSGSMGSNNKWNNAKSGIQSFVNDPNSAGIKVALQYFPGSGSCNGNGYNQPAVPLAALPGNASAIMNSLNSTNPSGITPTEGALRGLTRFCKAYEKAHPQEKCVGLLVTDGHPNGCNGSTSYLANIAGNAYSGSPSVLTFAMGMQGADFNVLDPIATSGGTGPKALDVSQGGAQAFVQALQNIAGQILSCDFQMPATDAGTVNPDSIIMSFTSGAGQKQSLQHVTDKSACTAAGGFYYDNNASPSKITLCPSTCNSVQSDKKGKIQILLDCTKLGPA